MPRRSRSSTRPDRYWIATLDGTRLREALAVTGDAAEAHGQRAWCSGPTSWWMCSRVFPARPDQVVEARAFLGRMLHGCPLIYEAQLICSELVTNAIRHSCFTVT